MKRSNNIIWGVLIVILGVVLALKAFGIMDIDLFFDGWWTLFIIVPSLVGLTGGHDHTGNLIGLFISVLLLLCCRGVLDLGAGEVQIGELTAEKSAKINRGTPYYI